jgi:hypothetical protein
VGWWQALEVRLIDPSGTPGPLCIGDAAHATSLIGWRGDQPCGARPGRGGALSCGLLLRGPVRAEDLARVL